MLLIIVLKMIALGLVVGLLSGVFGIGGGILIVPIVSMLYDFQLAIAISLGAMILSSAVTIAIKFIQTKILWLWVARLLPGMIIGVIFGSILHHFLHGDILKIVLYIVMIMIGIKILFNKTSVKTISTASPSTWFTNSFGGILGILSGMLGIGVGSFCVPYLLHHRITMQQTAGVVAVCTFIISSIGFAIAMLQTNELTNMNNLIFWYGFIAISFTCCYGSIIGVILSKQIHTIKLQNAFALLLVFFGAIMLANFILK